MSTIDLSKFDTEFQEKFNNLSDDEQSALLKILEEYALTGSSDTLELFNETDFDEIPVDIETFLYDPNYLGAGLINENGKMTVFPYWIEKLKEIFPDNLSTRYNTIILTGSIGLGKSFIAVVCQLYLLYRMLCLKDPYAYYGLQPIDKITFSMLNVTIEAAQGVGWDKMQQLLQSSKWFMERGSMNASRTNPQWKPPKGIELIYGSSNRHVVGRALFCLDGDTEIATISGNAKLKDLVNECVNVISIDDGGNKVISDNCTVLPTIKTSVEYQIELEDGSVIKCTPNHKLMLKDGTYKEAQYLNEFDELADCQPNAYFDFLDNIINTRGQ